MTSTQKTLLAGCLFGMILSAAAVVFTACQNHLRSYYGSEPRAVSLAALARQQEAGQRWIELAGGRLGPHAFVTGEDPSKQRAWVPLFAQQRETGAPIHVVLHSNHCTGLDEFALRVRDRKTFRGALHNAAELDPSVRDVLAKSYPGHPLPAVIWALDIDFTGPPLGRWAGTVHSAAGGLLVFGVICLLGFIGSCFARRDDLIAPDYADALQLRA